MFVAVASASPQGYVLLHQPALHHPLFHPLVWRLVCVAPPFTQDVVIQLSEYECESYSLIQRVAVRIIMFVASRKKALVSW